MAGYSFTGTAQFVTVAKSGTFDITAYGAEGGAPVSRFHGGYGAEYGGGFYLKAGTKLEIIVGGAGARSNTYEGGGGGGSFVLANTGPGGTYQLLLAAGGGGGFGYSTLFSQGGNAIYSGSGNGSGGQGGRSLGGSGPPFDGGAGGGSGYNGAGTHGTYRYAGGSGVRVGLGGSNRTGGYAGGLGFGGKGDGGFGGGGGYAFGGGGGGGFTGGNGGYNHGGYGGTSFDAAGAPLVAKLATAENQSNSGNGFVEITPSIACFCRGTLIETKRGQKKVENLKIGDEVVIKSGALQPIKWIGRRSYGGRFIMGRTDILPICFKAGSLADNVPKRDLWISPHHAMFIDGVLIEAKDLVNGVSIVQAERVEKVEYFHIELETHDVIVAEGALSETFIDDDSRGMFHNADEFAARYPQAQTVAAYYCAPRLENGYQMEAVRHHIATRAGLLPAVDASGPGALLGLVDQISVACIAGWAQNSDAPEAPVCLDIFADGELIGQALANAYRDDLKAAGFGGGRHGFAFTPPAGMALSIQTLEVRRSFDGALLQSSRASTARMLSFSVGGGSCHKGLDVKVYRRAARQ